MSHCPAKKIIRADLEKLKNRFGCLYKNIGLILDNITYFLCNSTKYNIFI